MTTDVSYGSAKKGMNVVVSEVELIDLTQPVELDDSTATL